MEQIIAHLIWRLLTTEDLHSRIWWQTHHNYMSWPAPYPNVKHSFARAIIVSIRIPSLLYSAWLVVRISLRTQHTLSCRLSSAPEVSSLLSGCRTPTRERRCSRRVWRLDLLVCHIYDIVYIAGGRAISCFNFPLNLCCTCTILVTRTVLKRLVTSALKRAVGH